MKRIDENVYVTLPPVRLYFDDLDQVVETVSKQDRVEITHGRVLYDSLAELRSNLAVESLRSLQIYAFPARGSDQWGSLTIRFEPSNVEIRGSEVMRERAAAAAVFLSRQTPWYSWYPTNHLPLWQGFLGALWTTALALGGAVMYLESDWNAGLFFVYLGLLFVGFAVLVSDARLGATRIFLYSRHGKPTFWQKNKDAILVGVITALVSGAVGFVLGRITGTPPVH